MNSLLHRPRCVVSAFAVVSLFTVGLALSPVSRADDDCGLGQKLNPLTNVCEPPAQDDESSGVSSGDLVIPATGGPPIIAGAPSDPGMPVIPATGGPPVIPVGPPIG